MKKKILTILLILISMALIIGVFFFVFFDKNEHTIKIKKELHGVKINKATLEIIENISVIINGNINKIDDGFTFTGDLYLSNLEYTKDNSGLLVHSKGYGKDGFKQRGTISYSRNIRLNGKVIPDYAMLHWVDTDSNFSYMVIANYDEDCINNTDKDSLRVYQGNDILVFPATNAETAIKLIQELQIDKEIFQKTSAEEYGINN